MYRSTIALWTGNSYREMEDCSHGRVSRRHPSLPMNAPSTAPIALVLIDDNRLLREGIAAMIQSQPGFKVLASIGHIVDLPESGDPVLSGFAGYTLKQLEPGTPEK